MGSCTLAVSAISPDCTRRSSISNVRHFKLRLRRRLLRQLEWIVGRLAVPVEIHYDRISRGLTSSDPEADFSRALTGVRFRESNTASTGL